MTDNQRAGILRIFLVCALLLVPASQLQAAGSGGINSPKHLGKPYVILVSIDGFRWDYQDLYDTPALDRIAQEGVRAERLIPVFPTLTFPNHYSIATGLYPANHGLVGNTFATVNREAWYSISRRETVEDGWWYGGVPIWVAAETAGMVTAAYYFVGTEAAVQGVPMSHWHTFDETVPGMKRVDQVLEWLELPPEQRPHLVTLYFEDVDKATHDYGPGSRQSVDSIRRVDQYIEKLQSGLDALPHGGDVYLIVVSDHGQMEKKVDEEIFLIDSVVDTQGLAIVNHGAVAFVYIPNGPAERAVEVRDAINENWAHGRAYLPRETPEAWKVTENSRFADVIVQADPGFLVFSGAARVEKKSRGDHGWAPEAEGMHGIFLASGPGLPHGRQIDPIRAVDIYPLMMKILGLPITTSIDGDPEALVHLLKAQ